MNEGSKQDGARVRRVDGRLGLALCRASLSPRTLLTYARDHLVVRTPSRPDFRDGNVLDLEAHPTADELDGWFDRFAATVGAIGAPHRRLRWETALPGDAPAAAPEPDEGLARAALARGLTLEPLTALLLGDQLAEVAAAPIEVVPVAPPSAEPGGAVDRRWHAATVLYRYMDGDSPDDWRAVPEEFTAWAIDVQRELALVGRAQVWLAMRHGTPVARLTVLHDQQGLAVVEDVVVHPAHRRRGIASALVHEAVLRHLDVHPGDRIGIVAEPGSGADRLYRRLGFAPHATIWQATGAP